MFTCYFILEVEVANLTDEEMEVCKSDEVTQGRGLISTKWSQTQNSHIPKSLLLSTTLTDTEIYECFKYFYAK